MNTQRLIHAQTRARPALSLGGDVALPFARAHECCGNARHSFAMWVATKTEGPVYWISPNWQAEQLNPDGMIDLVAPQRFTFIAAQRPEDILWTLEEILRSGAVALAIADIPGIPGLTSIRRLHLAAETGALRKFYNPLGLLLTPGEGGAQGIETRWHMQAAHIEDQTRAWALERRRARTAPQKSWHVSLGAKGFQLGPKPTSSVE